MTDTDQTGDQAAGDDIPEPPFTWYSTRTAAFSVQRDLADAAKAGPGSDEWNDGLLNAAMYCRAPARAAEELRRVADLAEGLSRRLTELFTDSDREDWDGFDPAAVDLSPMADATMQLGLYADALVIGAADQERERLSQLIYTSYDSAFTAWTANRHPLAETVLENLLLLLGKDARSAWDYLHRWLLLTEFTARAITGDRAAGSVLDAVGLGADMVHRIETLAATDRTTAEERQAIARAEHDQVAGRSQFTTWAGGVLAREN